MASYIHLAFGLPYPHSVINEYKVCPIESYAETTLRVLFAYFSKEFNSATIQSKVRAKVDVKLTERLMLRTARNHIFWLHDSVIVKSLGLRLTTLHSFNGI